MWLLDSFLELFVLTQTKLFHLFFFFFFWIFNGKDLKQPPVWSAAVPRCIPAVAPCALPAILIKVLKAATLDSEPGSCPVRKISIKRLQTSVHWGGRRAEELRAISRKKKKNPMSSVETSLLRGHHVFYFVCFLLLTHTVVESHSEASNVYAPDLGLFTLFDRRREVHAKE